MIGFYPVDMASHKGPVYCGPYCVAAVTGWTPKFVNVAINRYRGAPRTRNVKATTIDDLEYAMLALGYTHRQLEAHELWENEPTFTQWLKANRDRRAYYLVLITGHWVLVRGDWMTDTGHDQPVDLSRRNPYARKRIRAWLKINA